MRDVFFSLKSVPTVRRHIACVNPVICAFVFVVPHLHFHTLPPLAYVYTDVSKKHSKLRASD